MRIDIPAAEIWDEGRQRFFTVDPMSIDIEHNLLAISKWEAHYKKPFLTKEQKSMDEFLYYVSCMCVPDFVKIQYIDPENQKRISDFIEDEMSATTFSKNSPKGGRAGEQITSELVYYWMSALQIPFQPCETWHFQRLMNLIRIANIKQQPPKKMSRNGILKQNRSLNAARRSAMGSMG